MKTTRTRPKTVKLRKNGRKEIDAASTIDAPTGAMRRVIRNNRAGLYWQFPTIASFTPAYVEMILRGALAGDHIRQWELFDLMLETWPVLASCQSELLYGVTRREVVFDPYKEEDEPATDSAIEKEKLVTCAIRNMNPDPTADENDFSGTIQDIMDAWFRGVSVLEILWQRADTDILDNAWTPKSTAWINPRYYGFNQEGILGLTGADTQLGYNNVYQTPPNQQQLFPFPDNQFLIAIHKVKSGSPLGGPMLRSLAWWWCATNFSSDWLLNLAQVFGLPFRWANYASSAPDETIGAICDMLQNMGSAGWAAFPEGTTLELKEPSRSASQSPQADLLDRADAYARMMILGQTLTGQTIASGRGGQAFGTVEAQLKQDRLDAASAFVAGVINRQLIPAILLLNYGDITECPSIRFLQESEGTYQDAQRDQILSSLGLNIPLSHLRQKYNIPEPTGDEETTTPPPKPTVPTARPASTGPAGTRPIGQTPDRTRNGDVQARIAHLFEIEDDAMFSKELCLIVEATKGETKHERTNQTST